MDDKETLADEIEKLTEQEALLKLDEVKNDLCRKVKNLSQEKESQKEKKKMMRELVNILEEEIEEAVIMQSIIEDHLKRLDAVK